MKQTVTSREQFDYYHKNLKASCRDIVRQQNVLPIPKQVMLGSKTNKNTSVG